MKHRGAFEQAYVAFCQVMTILWRKSGAVTEKGQRVPERLLSGALETAGSGYIATRRSAGFPFIIQGVLATAPSQELLHSEGILKSALDRLFAMARHESW